MGIGQDDIAKQLNVSLRSVGKYIKAKKQELREQLKAKTAEDIINELQANSMVRIRRLWAMMKDAPNNEKMRILDSLREEDKESMHRMQVIGIFPKDIQLNVNNTQINTNLFIKAEDFKQAYDEHFSKRGSKDQERQGTG